MKPAMRLLAALGVFAALAASASPFAATSKEPKKVIVPAVQARAKRIAIQLGDLPGLGWKSSPAQSDRSSPRCSYYNPDRSRLTENADYISPDYTRADGIYVSSSVGIFVSAQQAQTAFGLVVRPQLARCLGESVAKSGKPGAIKLHSAGKLAFARYGDRSAAYRIVFLVKSGNDFVQAMIDIVAINKGPVDAALFFSSAGQPVPPSIERKVTGAVAARMSK
jgi:hypothetical protein